MTKRIMIQSNLVKNSIAAYFSAIELHNKPSISYRYETVVLLMINAWELALKAYIKKYIKHRSIFETNGHTISLGLALNYVNDNINSAKPKSFIAIKENIEAIESYRNNIAHFYCDCLEPYIFMLLSRSALNYVEFIKKYFSKDIMALDGMFILPLGFKLPFKPEEFLSRNVAKYAASPEAQHFIDSIVTSIRNLKAAGIEDSIVLGFEIQFESVKKTSNSTILAAITSSEAASTHITKNTIVRITTDPSAKAVSISDNDFFNIWKYSSLNVAKWCRSNIPNFSQNRRYFEIKRSLKNDLNYCNSRRLDSRNQKSPSQEFYTDAALERIRKEYLLQSVEQS